MSGWGAFSIIKDITQWQREFTPIQITVKYQSKIYTFYPQTFLFTAFGESVSHKY